MVRTGILDFDEEVVKGLPKHIYKPLRKYGTFGLLHCQASSRDRLDREVVPSH